MFFIINKKLYNKILLITFLVFIIFLLYNLIVYVKTYYENKNHKITEPFAKKIGRGIKKGFKKAKSGVSKIATDVAKKAEQEAKRIAEETKRAAEEAKRLAEEAAQAIQIQNAIKEFNRAMDRTSDIFNEIGENISEIKGLGSSYAKNVKEVTNSFDKL